MVSFKAGTFRFSFVHGYISWVCQLPPWSKHISPHLNVSCCVSCIVKFVVPNVMIVLNPRKGWFLSIQQWNWSCRLSTAANRFSWLHSNSNNALKSIFTCGTYKIVYSIWKCTINWNTCYMNDNMVACKKSFSFLLHHFMFVIIAGMYPSSPNGFKCKCIQCCRTAGRGRWSCTGDGFLCRSKLAAKMH